MSKNDEIIEKLIFLIQTSKDRIDRLFTDKYNLESKAGVLIGFGAIFFTFKIALTGTSQKYWFIPLITFLIGLILIVIVIWPNKLGVGSKESNYDKLFGSTRTEMLTKILKDNRASIIKNSKKLKKIKLYYGLSVIFIIVSILLSFIISGLEQNKKTNHNMESNYFYYSSPDKEESEQNSETQIDISPSPEEEIDIQEDDSDKK